MDLLWSAGVASTDRWMGRLDGVLVEDDPPKVTHLVVKRGPLLPKRVAVPLGEMERSDQEGVRLSLSTLDFLRLPRLEARDGRSPRLVFGPGTRILLQGGGLLRLKGVKFSSSSQVLDHLIVGRRGWLGSRTVVPLSKAREVTSKQVALDVQSQDLMRFPRYRSDRDIENGVWEALYGHQPNAGVDMGGVSVRVASGTVTLEGNVRLPSTREEATRLVGSVQGVTGVENRLLSDWDVELMVASALARDGRSEGGRILVHSALGRVTLRGTAPSEEVKRSVASAVEGLAGVLGIEDRIVVEMRPSVPSVAGETLEASEKQGEPAR